MDSGGREFNHAHAQSLNEYGKNLSLNESCDSPAILKASLTSKICLR